MSDKNTSFIRSRIMGATVAAGIIVATSAFCTQFVASRLAYHPALGSPLFGRFYNPFDWWQWAFRFFDYAPDTHRYAFFIFGVGTIIAMLISKLIVGIKSRSSRKHEGIHGTASFATAEQVRQSGLLPVNGKPGAGVYCGGFDDPETGRTEYLRHNGPEHVCVIAPPRSGKGVGNIIPTLLSCLDSVFTLDIKGENYAMSAGWRKLVSKVLRYDPADENSCSWNPIGEIRFGTRHQISDAQNIALMVVDHDGKGIEGNHWRTAAFELISGLIMHSLYKSQGSDDSCLTGCAYMLTGGLNPDLPEYDDGARDSAAMSVFIEMQAVTLATDDRAAIEAQLFIRSIGRSMADKPEKELGSIISTANNALSLYRDPVVGGNTSRSDFKISDLMDHDSPVSLYFIAAPTHLSRLSPLIRLFLTRIVTGLTEQMTFDNGRSKTAHKHRLLLMLDEFAALGRLDVFEKALAYISGYGIKAFIIIQDRQQLLKAYSAQESILSNCHIQIAYAPNNIETAEWLSKMAGTTTVIKEQITTSGKRFGHTLGQVSRSYQEVSRPLLTPQEVRNLPKAVTDGNGNILEAGEMLIFVAGMQVIRGRQILYFLDPTFSKRSKIAPPSKSDVVRLAVPKRGAL